MIDEIMNDATVRSGVNGTVDFMEAMAQRGEFLDFDIPEKISIFIEQYADRKKIFESILLNKLEGFYDDLGWKLNLNPYRNTFFNL